jgi:hypothetical protein
MIFTGGRLAKKEGEAIVQEADKHPLTTSNPTMNRFCAKNIDDPLHA